MNCPTCGSPMVEMISSSFCPNNCDKAKKEEVKTENIECQEDSTDEDLAMQELKDQYGEELIEELHTGCYCYDDAQSIKEYFEDNYEGEYKTMGDWAYEWLENSGQLEEIPEYIKNYINFDSYGRDAIYGGEVFKIEVNGTLHVFRNG